MAVNVTGGPLEFVAQIDDKQLNASLRKMEANINRSVNAAVKDADRMDAAFRNVGAGIAAYFSVQQLSHFATQVAHVRGEFQQLEIALETILKSKAEADKLFADVVQLAAVTPFTFREVADGTKQLLAYGFAADEVIEATRRLGDVSAGLKIPLGDLIYLYGTTRVQQRLYARDLLQFTQRGIPLISELAKQFGVTESQIDEMVTAGKVGFEDVRTAIESLTNEGGTFANLMTKFSTTIPGQIARLQDAWQVMLNDIGEDNQETIGTVINLSREAVENYETILDILKVLIATYGTYRAALIATAAAQGLATASGNIRSWFELARGIRTAKDAQIAFNLAVRANPIGLIAGAIAGLITYLVVFRDETESLTAAQKNLNDVQIDAAQAVATQEQKLKDLIAVARDETELLSDRRKAIAEINTISPEYLGNLNLETVGTDAATDATRRYIDALKDRAIEEAIAAKRTELTRRLIEEQLTPASPTLTDQFVGGALNLFSFNQDRQFAASVVNRRMQQAKNERINGIQQEIDALDDFAKAQTRTNETREEEPPVIRRTVSVIEEEIKALKDQQKTVAESRTEWLELQKQINALEAERLRITGEQAKGVKSQAYLAKEFYEKLSGYERDFQLAQMDGFEKQYFLIKEKYAELLEIGRRAGLNLVEATQMMERELNAIPITNISARNSKIPVSAKVVPILNEKKLLPLQKKIVEINEDFAGTADILSDLANITRDWDTGLADVINSVAAVANGIASANRGFATLTSDKAKSFSDMFGAISGIVGGAGAIFGAIQGIAGLFDKSAEREADRQRALQFQIRATEALTKAMERQLELIQETYGTERIDAYNAAVEELERNIQETSDRLKGSYLLTGQQEFIDRTIEFLNAGKSMKDAIEEGWGINYSTGAAEFIQKFLKEIPEDVEELQQALDKGLLDEATAADARNLIKMKEQLKQAANDFNEEITGVGFDGLLNDIVSLFDQGKISAADFARSFEDLMQKAILNSFKREFLEKQLQGFYNTFADLSEEGLTPSEIAQLQAAYTAIIGNAKEGFEAIQQATGIEFGSQDQGQQQGLSGAIRREMTEETAGELAGLWRGQYDLVKQQLQADLAALDHLNAIEMNTANTVARLDTAVTELQAINANTKQGQTARDLSI